MLPANLIHPEERAQATRQQDERCAKGEKGELRGTTGSRVEGRAATGSDPHGGDSQEHDGGDRHTDTEANGVENAGVMVAKAFRGAVHD